MLDQIHIKPIYAFLILLIVAICSFGLGYGIPREEYAVRESARTFSARKRLWLHRFSSALLQLR